MGLHKSSHDVQAQAGATSAGPVPEPGEDHRVVLGGDALALVADSDGNGLLAILKGRSDGQTHGPLSVTHRILHQVGQDLVEPVRVGPHLGQRCLMPGENEPLALITTGDESFDVPINCGVDIDRLFTHLQSPGVDA